MKGAVVLSAVLALVVVFGPAGRLAAASEPASTPAAAASQAAPPPDGVGPDGVGPVAGSGNRAQPSAQPASATRRPAAAPTPTPKPTSLGAVRLDGRHDQGTAEPVRIALLLGLLTILPALAICMTPFVRIVVVLSMVRHAFGMPETPPNQVLVTLAFFLTCFVMMPTFSAMNSTAIQPFLSGSLTVQEAVDRGAEPLRGFMLRQVHDKDIAAIYEISRKPLPAKAADVGTAELTSAFMLNELRVSFKIGFVVLLPFLLIELVVSAILLSLGMLMVPPSTLSLPLKVLMFVLIDGWSLVVEGVVGSFR